MSHEFTENHFSDEKGCPMGGTTFGPGFAIGWQNGALGRDGERLEQNGAFVETVIEAVIGRLGYYQSSKFQCESNHAAIVYLQNALGCLRGRTAEREARKVEGTHEV